MGTRGTKQGVQLATWVSEEEASEIRRTADLCRMSVSALFRMLVMLGLKEAQAYGRKWREAHERPSAEC